MLPTKSVDKYVNQCDFLQKKHTQIRHHLEQAYKLSIRLNCNHKFDGFIASKPLNGLGSMVLILNNIDHDWFIYFRQFALKRHCSSG